MFELGTREEGGEGGREARKKRERIFRARLDAQAIKEALIARCGATTRVHQKKRSLAERVLPPNNLACAPSLLYGDGEINFAADYYQAPAPWDPGQPFFFVFFIIIIIITYTTRGTESLLCQSTNERSPSGTSKALHSFLSFLLSSSPLLVNLLINYDCKPDNAVFAIFILLPLSLHATPSTLSLYTYVYTYSIDFHSKTNV